MRLLRAALIITVFSVAAGLVWDILVWRLHFPYLPFHWLGRLLHTDGEGAYTSMMYEMMILFFLVFSVVWILFRRRFSK